MKTLQENKQNLRRVQEAHDQIRRHGGSPGVAVYTQLIQIYGKHNRPNLVRGVEDEMHAHHTQFTIVTYNSLITAYGNCEQGSEVLRVEKELRGSPLRPNIITYNSLITAYGLLDSFGDCERIFRLAIVQGLVNDVSIRAFVSASYASRHLRSRALALLQNLFSAGDVHPFALDLYRKEKQYEVVLQASQRILDTVDAPADYKAIAAINRLYSLLHTNRVRFEAEMGATFLDTSDPVHGIRFLCLQAFGGLIPASARRSAIEALERAATDSKRNQRSVDDIKDALVTLRGG